MSLLRSPHARANIARLDVERARRAPGVLLVVTGAEVSHLAPMPVNRLVPGMRVPPHPIIAETDVHATGTPVAAVVAEDAYAARDALELIRVRYEPLPALPEPEGAAADGAPRLFADVPGNLAFVRTIREGGVLRCAQHLPLATTVRAVGAPAVALPN